MSSTPTHSPTEDQANRTSRHLAMLEEMAEIAMALTRNAAEKAQAQLENPLPDPVPETKTAPETDPVLAFTRLARTVRQIIALEARIADPTPKAPQQDPAETRHLIAEAVRDCANADPAATTRHGPTRTRLDRHIDERIDADDITQLIAQNANVADIIERICTSLGIPFDITQQPTENLLPLTEAAILKRSNPPLPPRDCGTLQVRHDRACPGHPRPGGGTSQNCENADGVCDSACVRTGVDTLNTPGQDEVIVHATVPPRERPGMGHRDNPTPTPQPRSRDPT